MTKNCARQREPAEVASSRPRGRTSRRARRRVVELEPSPVEKTTGDDTSPPDELVAVEAGGLDQFAACDDRDEEAEVHCRGEQGGGVLTEGRLVVVKKFTGPEATDLVRLVEE